MLYEDPAYFALARQIASQPLVPHTCLIAEVTERCDVGCATCSASSVGTGQEPGFAELVESVSIKAARLGCGAVALSGGEPLMRSDIWDIADALHRKVGKIVLITSGRGMEADPGILSELAARKEWLEVYMQFDSLQDEVLSALRSPFVNAQLRKDRLGLAVATGAATTTVCVVPPDATAEKIGELAAFSRGAGAAGVTFQPLRRVGRIPELHRSSTHWATVDQVQRIALAALGVENADPRPFEQQPFDMSVALLDGAHPVWPDTFFQSGRHLPGFRVSTSSYWDFTNYFAPLAHADRFYFMADVDVPLNARYFPEGIPAAPLETIDHATAALL